MQHISKIAGVLIIGAILSLPAAICEVEKIAFGTDESWKTIDFEDSNWTSMDYDDSWWEDATAEVYWSMPLNAKYIWYPGDWPKNVAYFRKILDVPENTIVNSEIKAKTSGAGEIELYVNSNKVSRIKIVYEPVTIDIKPFIKPGKNVIAAKVTQPKEDGRSPYIWILEGLVRYNSTQ